VNAAKHALVIAPGGAGPAVEKDSEPLPAFANDPTHVGSLQLVRRQNVQHDGPRGRRDVDHSARSKKGGPEAALAGMRAGLIRRPATASEAA
jgi:hypothetical protein